MQNKNIILGIDPGYGRMGIALIESESGKQKLIHSECFETSAKTPHSQRLLALGEKVGEIIETYSPDQVAIETLLFSKNQKTAIQVAEARGVIILESAKRGIKIREFNPNQIKLAVTGYGKSDKKQIINMVEKLLKIKTKMKYDDEYDAIASALTCAAIPLSTEYIF